MANYLKNFETYSAVILSLAFLSAHSDEGLQVEYKPLHFGGVQEFGTIQQGVVKGWRAEILDHEWVDHFGTYFVQEALVDRRLELQIGLGGVFQFGKPEKVDERFGGSQYKMFFVGPAIAKAMVRIGDKENPLMTLGGGMFPYKYNPDAVDLGDYLFRSAPYPTYIINGGLLHVNDNAAYLQGFHGSSKLGNLKLDLLFTTETNMPPLYDWSLGLVANYSVAGGIFEIGAGVNLKRLVQVNPNRTSRDTIFNSYFTRNGKQYFGKAHYYEQKQAFYSAKYDSAVSRRDTAIARGDVAGAAYQSQLVARYYLPDSIAQADYDSISQHWLNPFDSAFADKDEQSYFTPAGTLFMARVAIDLGKLLNFGPDQGAFKIFAEGAVLGWKNYPVFFENRMDRAPIMVGAQIPTFGLLQQLTFQFEYFNSPWSNSTYYLGATNTAIPSYPDGGDAIFSNMEYNDVTKHDNYAWAVVLSRRIVSHVSLNAQFARDHMRTVGSQWFYGGSMEPEEVLYRNSSWYWMVQLAWGL